MAVGEGRQGSPQLERSRVKSMNALSVEGFMIRNPVAWDRLSRVLADVYGVASEAVGQFKSGFESDGAAVPILVETHEHQKGFRLDVPIYVKVEIDGTRRGIPLAQRVAAALGEDVLTSPPASHCYPPWRWVLASPAGLLVLVDELTPDSDDLIVDL